MYVCMYVCIMKGMWTETRRRCTFLYSSPYPIEKVRDSPYPFNAGISRRNNPSEIYCLLGRATIGPLISV